MVSLFISIGLLLAGMITQNGLYCIAAGLYAIAASICWTKLEEEE